jgi:DNA-binding CsgD family transcriptional regulator
MMTELDRALKAYTANAQHVAELASPLMSLGVLGLVFLRVYPDGSIINMPSRADWTYRSMYAGAYCKNEVADCITTREGLSLWALNSNNKTFQDVKQYFGLGNGITFTENKQEYTQIMMLYADADDTQINHTYLQHLEVLKKFTRFFEQQAHQLIEQAQASKNSFTHHPLLHQDSPKGTGHKLADWEALLASVDQGKTLDWDTLFGLSCEEMRSLLKKPSYRINKDALTVSLSKMELMTIALLLKGKHAGEIRHSLGIGQSTVESYLINIKNKLGVHRKSELIETLIKYQLLKQITL